MRVTSDPAAGRYSDARCAATHYRGYEVILGNGRDYRDAPFVGSRCCGYHGGQHSIAAVHAVEMALGLEPPPMAIAIRNMGISAETIHAEAAHLVLLVGPDFNEQTMRANWPDLWAAAEKAPAPQADIHGYPRIGDIMRTFNPLTGRLYKDAFGIARIPLQMYALINGKYPHPETVVPGGLATSVSATTVSKFHDYVVRLLSLVDPAKQVVTMVDDLFNFCVEKVPQLAEVGATPANFIDSGQWDSHEGYDPTWEGLTERGNKRWGAPGVILDGRLVTTDLKEIADGITETAEHSFYDGPSTPTRPFDKTVRPRPGTMSWDGRYSWANTVRWNGRMVETGPGARLATTAMRGNMVENPFIAAEDGTLYLNLPEGGLPQTVLEWRLPTVWNAIERNRARLYGIVFAALVAANEALGALQLQKLGEVETSVDFRDAKLRRQARGVGFAGDGMLAHWMETHRKFISNYQVVAPSTINCGPGGPAEEAINGTPVLTENAAGLEAEIALRSFDPCSNCATH